MKKTLGLRAGAMGLLVGTLCFSFSGRPAVAAPNDAAVFLEEAAGKRKADGFGKPGDHAGAEKIEKDYADFTAVYKDYAGLFSADDFRTPAQKKHIEKLKLDSPEVLAKLPEFRKKLDALQKKMRNLMLLNAVRVSATQFSRIHKLAQQAASRLELRGVFNVFILRSPVFNAFTYSYNASNFDVVLHSALVENLSDDALLAILGHEMGHVKDQALVLQLVMATEFESRNKDTAAATHAKYYARLFNELPSYVRGDLQQSALEIVAEGGQVGAASDDAATSDFSRNCEITADRAGVIATGFETSMLRALSTLAYGSKALSPEFNIEELIQQITDVLTNNDEGADIDFMVESQETHPFNVLRLIQVRDFAASKGFAGLKDRLAQEPFARELDLFTRNVARAGELAAKLKKYREEKAETDDTLVRLKTERQFSDQLGSLAGAVGTLGQLVLLQLEGSDLAAADNAVYRQFIEKLKADQDQFIKTGLAPAVIGMLKRLLQSATTDEAKKELQAKLKTLQELKELE